MCLLGICELHKHNKNRRQVSVYLLLQDICTSLLNKQLRVLFIEQALGSNGNNAKWNVRKRCIWWNQVLRRIEGAMAQGEAGGWKKESDVSLEGFLKQDLN